jgi:hypothetical protein
LHDRLNVDLRDNAGKYGDSFNFKHILASFYALFYSAAAGCALSTLAASFTSQRSPFRSSIV